jgi:WS/DGAT/MGAT family acyltransferase
MPEHTYPMGPVDAAWYHIDGPANLAQVTGIALTREPLDFDRVKAVYRARLARFDRFRQRIVEQGFPIATPHWEDVPGFTIDQHFEHIALPAPGDRAVLTDLLSTLASTPLDRDWPLWQIHIVDGVEGGGALIMRFHHCIGDGTAMMAMLQEVFDEVPDAPIGNPQPNRTRPHPKAGLLDRVLGPAVDAVDWSTRTVAALLDAAAHPQRVVNGAELAFGGIATLITELLKTPDPPSPLKGEFHLQKRVAWSAPVALSDVKAIGKLSGAKVNDVLVAGMTGALRGYLAGRGVDVDASQLRAMVPVDLRPRERALELGNEFGLVILDLAVSSADPIERLTRTKVSMDALKQSPEAVAIMTLFNIFGRGPKLVEDVAVDLFSSKASLVMTNVAGPLQTLYVAGVPIDRMMFWVPHPGRQLGMGVSILSYNGSASLAVISDAHLIPDPEVITEAFTREFHEMLAVAQRAFEAPPRGGRRRRRTKPG